MAKPRPMILRIAHDALDAGMQVTREGPGVFIRASRQRAVRIFPNGTGVRADIHPAYAKGMRSEREIREVLGLRPEYRCGECSACQEWWLTPDQAPPCTVRSPDVRWRS